MKKILISFFICCVIFILSGCKDEGQNISPGNTGTGKIRLALILPSGKDDLAWSQSMYEGVMEVQKEMGEEKLEVSVTEKIPNPVDAGTALRDYAARGFDIIIAHGSQYQTPVFDVASEFPSISFAYGTAFKTGENIFAYDPQTQQGGYLFGMMAAKLTKSKTVGIVGPVKAGDAIKYNYAFSQGVKAVSPDIKVLESYTGSFVDTVKAKEMAIAHMDDGADILTGTTQQVVGAIQGVSEKKGVYWFSNDMDQTDLAPEKIIACQVYKWKNLVKDIIDKHKEGKMGNEKLSLDFSNNGLEIVFNPALKDLITPEIKSIFDENFEKIKKGELDVKLPGE